MEKILTIFRQWTFTPKCILERYPKSKSDERIFLDKKFGNKTQNYKNKRYIKRLRNKFRTMSATQFLILIISINHF